MGREFELMAFTVYIEDRNNHRRYSITPVPTVEQAKRQASKWELSLMQDAILFERSTQGKTVLRAG